MTKPTTSQMIQNALYNQSLVEGDIGPPRYYVSFIHDVQIGDIFFLIYRNQVKDGKFSPEIIDGYPTERLAFEELDKLNENYFTY